MIAHEKLSIFGSLLAPSFLCVLLLSAPAHGQDIATADALFNKGLEDMKAGRYEAGCKEIAESQRLDPRPGTLFTLATCEADWGHIASAVTRFGDYLALYDRMPDDRKAAHADRARIATAQREKLGPEVPQLTLSLPKGAPSETIVKRDGEVVANLALGLALPAEPGEHVLSTAAPGGKVTEQRITLARGEKKSVTLLVDTPAPPPLEAKPKGAAGTVGPIATVAPTGQPPPGVPGRGGSRSYVGPIVAFGAGAAGLGVGIGLGVIVLGKRAELDKRCPNKGCPPSEMANLDGATTLSYGSTAGFVVAGLGAAVGVVLLLLPAPGADRAKKVGVRLGAGYAGLEGTF